MHLSHSSLSLIATNSAAFASLPDRLSGHLYSWQCNRRAFQDNTRQSVTLLCPCLNSYEWPQSWLHQTLTHAFLPPCLLCPTSSPLTSDTEFPGLESTFFLALSLHRYLWIFFMYLFVNNRLICDGDIIPLNLSLQIVGNGGNDTNDDDYEDYNCSCNFPCFPSFQPLRPPIPPHHHSQLHYHHYHYSIIVFIIKIIVIIVILVIMFFRMLFSSFVSQR